MYAPVANRGSEHVDRAPPAWQALEPISYGLRRARRPAAVAVSSALMPAPPRTCDFCDPRAGAGDAGPGDQRQDFRYAPLAKGSRHKSQE